MYELSPGSSVIKLANDLHQAGYLSHPYYFRFLAEYLGVTKTIKAGEYKLPYGITPTELMTILTKGVSVNQSLTIIEGWNIQQLLSAVNSHKGLKHSANGLNPRNVLKILGHSNTKHPEGLFYPDTYYFARGTSDVAFLERANQKLKTVLDKQWKMRQENLPLHSQYEALILASIVEKETGKVTERPMIAGVFIRRLAKGIRLQSDPTVIYGIGDTFNGDISRKDLISNTPYNTYLHTGLPPTPICMPSEAAINASLHPDKGKSLYFVAKGNGSHYFSSTLEEHNIAVRRFQLNN